MDTWSQNLIYGSNNIAKNCVLLKFSFWDGIMKDNQEKRAALSSVSAGSGVCYLLWTVM